jgi:hypothetical protein
MLVILITYFYEQSGLFKIISVKCCSVNNIFAGLNFLTCHASVIVKHDLGKSSIKFRICKYHPTSAPYSIFIFHSFTISFFCSTISPTGPGPPHYQGFTITLWHTTLSMSPLDEWSAWCRDLYLTNTQHTYMTDIHDPHRILIHIPPSKWQ